MTNVFAGVVVCVVVLTLAVATYRLVADPEARRQYVMTVRAIRWSMLPVAVLHIAAVGALAILLLSAVPLLRYGWWMMLGGSGNVVLGQTGRSGFVWRAVALLVPLWILLLIPRLAVQEELAYRSGCEDDSRLTRFRRQVVFGLGHAAAMGVPIAAGFVLIGSGMLYQLVYLVSIRGLLDNTTLVEVASAPTKLGYPPMPQGPYDRAAWDSHHEEFTRVVELNRAALDRWATEHIEQRRQREAQVDGLREIATARAAALHAVSNWLIVFCLIVWLGLRAMA